MKIAVLKEAAGETRCAAIPETVKKFIALGADFAVERGAGDPRPSPMRISKRQAPRPVVAREALKGAGIILAINGPDPNRSQVRKRARCLSAR